MVTWLDDIVADVAVVELVVEIFLSLMELPVVADVVVAAAAAAAADEDVEGDGESLFVLTSWTTLDEALRCLSPLILTIS